MCEFCTKIIFIEIKITDTPDNHKMKFQKMMFIVNMNTSKQTLQQKLTCHCSLIIMTMVMMMTIVDKCR